MSASSATHCLALGRVAKVARSVGMTRVDMRVGLNNAGCGVAVIRGGKNDII